MTKGDGSGLMIRTHTEDLGSNPIPEVFTYDVNGIVTTSFRKERPLVPAKNLVNKEKST